MPTLTVFMIIAIIIGAIIDLVLFRAGHYWGGGILTVVLISVFYGFRSIGEEERFVTELFGKFFRSLRPGLQWIIPGIETIRNIIPIWIQEVKLFEGDTSIEVDFKDGSATPRGVIAQVRVKSPDEAYEDATGNSWSGAYRATYSVENWMSVARNLFENAIRAYLNTLHLDEGLTMKGSGVDLKNQLPQGELAKIIEALDKIGIHLEQITIRDFDLSEDLLEARALVQTALRKADAAEHEAEAITKGGVGAIMRALEKISGKSTIDLQKEINKDPALKQMLYKAAIDLTPAQIAYAANAGQRVEFAGGQGVDATLAQLISLAKGGK
ncbi:MAG: Band 7 protein [Parcubacteria group bacterium GW2011_GWA1_36_12]|nr:MAG: Band 7 protein [Parcubacteria group bacterium GW2011_GWA1_36_12]